MPSRGNICSENEIQDWPYLVMQLPAKFFKQEKKIIIKWIDEYVRSVENYPNND